MMCNKFFNYFIITDTLTNYTLTHPHIPTSNNVYYHTMISPENAGNLKVLIWLEQCLKALSTTDYQGVILKVAEVICRYSELT